MKPMFTGHDMMDYMNTKWTDFRFSTKDGYHLMFNGLGHTRLWNKRNGVDLVWMRDDIELNVDNAVYELHKRIENENRV